MLRADYPAAPEAADFVLKRQRTGALQDAGAHTMPLSFSLAIPDHPSVDTADGAAVRMAVAGRNQPRAVDAGALLPKVKMTKRAPRQRGGFVMRKYLSRRMQPGPPQMRLPG
jgi:hypothetical protein